MKLERRYRRIIRLFPTAWREENEDVLVGTLLECAGSDRDRIPTADHVDLLRTAATLHWRAACKSPVGAEVSASIVLAASAGLALMAAASLALLARVLAIGDGLRYGTFSPVELLLATIVLSMWPLALLLASTRHARLSLWTAGSATALLTVTYLARSTRDFNFLTMDHLFLYLGLPIVVTLTLRSALKSGFKIDRRWIGVAAVVFVPLAAALTELNLHRLLIPPLPYSSPVLTIVAAFLLLAAPPIVAIGIFRPRVLFAAGILCTPIGAAGLGRLVDSLTIHDPRPGQTIAQIPQAIAVTAGSLLPAVALFLAGMAASLHYARQTTVR